MTITIEDLSPYGIEPLQPETIGTNMASLLEPEECDVFLNDYMEKIKAPNQRVAASMFIKYYSRVMMGPLLMCTGSSNRALIAPLSNCVFNDSKKVCLSEGCIWIERSQEQREIWRNQVLQQFLSEHLTPLIQAVSKKRVPAKILWENAAIRINSIYEKLIDAAKTEQEKEKYLEDFSYLKNASGTLFGLSDNPLSPYLKGESEVINGSQCVRKTCCLYYQIEGEKEMDYCLICPLKK
ncbi:IucA/IucC family C-terminal-domain containing protein [Alkalihalobacillus trypoxylicola]|uniref:Ferric siderophore reductase C-terminal domain-containing protein n=1 Tax=Alkalihalobacillus trypoxylicola TaxID=519424 RepID=A0A161P5C4_9BACI|nr:IucA/IucC family C-terminal-domain containing protein [Alkalihalobacillus trypoxylicola]KYG26079.1 hypothetical protein AZF04_13420 [Alkalihalobacillus trypoxylicola]